MATWFPLCRVPPRQSSFWVIAGFCSLSILAGIVTSTRVYAQLPGTADNQPEFSAKLTWRSHGKTSRAQLFVKGDRYRIEHLGGIRTDLGYASVTIVRLDEQRVWYVLSERRMVLSVPLTVEYLLPLTVKLEGEIKRSLIGDAFVKERPAILYEVVVRQGLQQETFYQWVDPETEALLRLMSRDRDWFVEYEHVVFSPQPPFYFETPLGYRKFESADMLKPYDG